MSVFNRYRIKRIKNLSIIPRWIIFLLDIVISAICFLSAYLIRSEFDFNVFKQPLVLTNLLILLAFNVSLFSLFKVYAGIIRFTGLQDTFRIFFVVVFVNAGYYLLDLLLLQWFEYRLISVFNSCNQPITFFCSIEQL